MSSVKQLVIITGGASGIGEAIAKRISQDGYRVLITYNSNANGAEECKRAIEASGGECDTIQLDVTCRVDIEDKLNSFLDKNTDISLYGLVSNAGITKDTLTGLMSDNDFRDVMETNLFGTFYLLRWSVKKMLLKNNFGTYEKVKING